MEALKIETQNVRSVLEGFERSKILEVYFARLDGRAPTKLPVELVPLYEIDLGHIKAFLLNQYPQDNLLSRFFKLMN